MSDENVLTKEIAEQFLADEYTHCLSVFTTIDDAAAENLSKHKGDFSLGGLTSLSDAAAESLSKRKGGGLNLSGLSGSAADILIAAGMRMKKTTMTSRMRTKTDAQP